MPLFAGNVEVTDLDFRHVNINTAQLVPSARVKGGVGRLKVEPSKVALTKETVDLGPVLLTDANLDIALSDTVPEDTTKTENNWQIAFTHLSVKRSAVKIHMPGDTLAIGVGLADVSAANGDINLGTGVYQVGTFDWRDGFVTYDNNFRPRQGLMSTTSSLKVCRCASTRCVLHKKVLSFSLHSTVAPFVSRAA